MGQEFNAGFPGVRQLQNLIRSKQAVDVKLVTGDIISGRVLWQDPQCLGIDSGDDKPVQIWQHAIAYIKPQT